ncbi:MAG TPA: M48 family metallopeptidase [Candidatus Gracilibacteria bacterium]|nr:M48 family metallopeptidase [Candidatus Gracilibacteria bacterium]
MAYLGIRQQIWRNNWFSLLTLLFFPTLLLGLWWIYLRYFTSPLPGVSLANLQDPREIEHYLNLIQQEFWQTTPWILLGVGLWAVFVYFQQNFLIKMILGGEKLSRKENPRIYNLLENLCISRGIPLPALRIIEDPALNAFASGLTQKNYAITLTTGIINRLNDEELEGVIAHELSHIINRDTRLMMTAIVFVGIFAMLTELLWRTFFWSRDREKGNKLVALLLIALGWLLSNLASAFLSRRREFMADASAVELTKKPLALASALEKIALNPRLAKMPSRNDVQALLIWSGLSGWFSTHPPIEKRIAVLRNF